MAKVFIAVLVAAVAVLIIFQVIDPNVSNVAGITQTSQVIGDGNSISVTISGEITRNGTYIMEANTTLGELITVAGGVTSNADELAYDTSYLLQDSYSFYIAPKYNNTDVCSLEPIVKVNINKDNEEELQQVNGIGSTIAKAIVDYRSKATYGRIEDLKNVAGIGNATFEKIKNYVRLREA